MISHMQSNRISHVTPDHVFNSSPLCEFVVALTYFVQQTLYSGSCGFIPIGLTDFMPPRPCKPSESWALMHRLPYFSTKLTVACGKATLCVCVCAIVPFLEASLCSLCTGAGSTKPCGYVSPESCFGWMVVCFHFPQPP